MDIKKEENKKKGLKRSKDLQDTQSKVDVRNIPISRVGIKDIRYPFSVSDKIGEIQSTIGTFTMSVGLPHDVKATHMSRFVKILEDQKEVLSIENFHHLIKNTTNILKKVLIVL